MKRISRLGMTLLGLVSATLASVTITSAASASAQKASSAPSGTVTFALPPGSIPTYIFPFVSGPNPTTSTFPIHPVLVATAVLVWYGKTPDINFSQSVGRPPVYSNGGRTVTITLNRDYRWSDGKPVTNRDVELWMNIFKVEKQNYLAYSVGSIPDDVTSMNFPSNTPYTFSITFNKAYSHLWLLYNQLSQITPIPQHVSERRRFGPVGNYDMTPAEH